MAERAVESVGITRGKQRGLKEIWDVSVRYSLRKLMEEEKKEGKQPPWGQH